MFLYFYRYYSMYGHVEKLAEEIKKGASSVVGVEAKLWQVCYGCSAPLYSLTSLTIYC